MIRATLAAVLVFALAPRFAHADVYTWTDEKGVLNVSNLTPPDGVQVEKTVHEVARASVPAPPPYPPPPMIDPAAQAEVQFLAQKVRQLEFEVELARRAPPPMDYAAYPPPPPMQYMVDTGPPQANYGCDPSWLGCSGWGLGYPAGIVVLNSPGFRRPMPGRGFHHRSPMQLPVRGRGGPHRG
jgi:hypothetical protein